MVQFLHAESDKSTWYSGAMIEACVSHWRVKLNYKNERCGTLSVIPDELLLHIRYDMHRWFKTMNRRVQVHRGPYIRVCYGSVP